MPKPDTLALIATMNMDIARLQHDDAQRRAEISPHRDSTTPSSSTPRAVEGGTSSQSREKATA